MQEETKNPMDYFDEFFKDKDLLKNFVKKDVDPHLSSPNVRHKSITSGSKPKSNSTSSMDFSSLHKQDPKNNTTSKFKIQNPTLSLTRNRTNTNTSTSNTTREAYPVSDTKIVTIEPLSTRNIPNKKEPKSPKKVTFNSIKKV